MEWPGYKALCARPDYWSRWILVQCIDLLDQLGEVALREILRVALQGNPLPMRADHKGFPASHMFRLGGFVDAWREFAECQEQLIDRSHCKRGGLISLCVKS